MAHDDEQQPNTITTSLPPDIILEILSRSPVKSLLRCRSVCKQWCSVISDPNFVKSHLTFSTTNNRYAHHRLILCAGPEISLKGCLLHDLLHHGTVNHLDLHYPLKHSDTSARVSGSCNGLLLLIAKDENDLIIWNPTTRTSIKLPHCSFQTDFSTLYGFGYDDSSDDYKVVGIPRVGDHGLYDPVAKIYSLKTGNWKEIDGFSHGFPASLSCTFLNGVLHWPAILGSGSSHSWKMVSFDLKTETFGEILQPVYEEGDKVLRLGALREGLCLLCDYSCDYSRNRADIWVMKVYGVKDSWTKLASIPYLDDPVRFRFSVPLWISHDGKILMQLQSKLVVYDPKNCSSSKIMNFDVCLEAYTFVESLVSPGDNNYGGI